MSVKNNKKIVLVNPPLSSAARYGWLGGAGGNEPPLGLCYLASVMRKEGLGVSIIDAQATGLDIHETAASVTSLHPRYVGITASTMAIERASGLARLIKSIDPEIKIIIGGCHVSALPEATLEDYAFINVGVIGEGEETFRELILALENNTDLKTVKGIATRGDGGVYISGSRMRIKDLDNLPYPAFDLLPDIRRFYRLPTQSLAGGYSFSLLTSRGCPGRCAFCDRKVFGNYVSMHGAEYIAEMVDMLHKQYRISNIMFEDDDFMFSKQRLLSLGALLRKKKLRIRWSALARIDRIDEESLEIAKDGGCWQVSYGIESGCQRILDFYKKGITKERIGDVLKITKKRGLKIKCFFIWGNPTEDKESIEETAAFIKGLNIDDISVTFFTPYPGSDLWPDIESYGNFDRDWQKMNCFELVFKPRGLERGYLIRTRKRALKYFYFRPKTILSYLTRIRSAAQLKELIVSAYVLFRYVFGREKKNAETPDI